ncbi:ATP-dependent 6-phosphofructokinase [Desulfothermus sp.]
MPTIRPKKIKVDTLGDAKIPVPEQLRPFLSEIGEVNLYVSEEVIDAEDPNQRYFIFEEAGPKEKIYFDPSKTKCAIVTCGGLCPGINDVIRSIVMEAHHQYKVAATLGIRYGLQGFLPQYGHSIWELTPENVSQIHEFGGTILGSSRGHQPPEEIVDSLERMNINILFMIGGDGTMKAASAIWKEIKKRKMKISVVGIPKTIDNDIYFVPRSFGFDTAVTKAIEAIRCAHTEATGAPNGIGMVKLMGRESGFIASEATLAQKDVNVVLIPEQPFELDGEHGLLAYLKKRIQERGHAVIVVAEGAGQDLWRREMKKNNEKIPVDASGNPILGDICGLLKEKIKKYFKEQNIPITLKFIDPSYIIRSVPANANDGVYCAFLGQHAVHAAMAGKTNMVVTKVMEKFVYLPLSLVTKKRRKLNVNSPYWKAVLASTGQPPQFSNK